MYDAFGGGFWFDLQLEEMPDDVAAFLKRLKTALVHAESKLRMCQHTADDEENKNRPEERANLLVNVALYELEVAHLREMIEAAYVM